MSQAENHAQFAIDGREPQAVILPHSLDHVSATLRDANERHTAVAPVGCGVFLHLGNVPRQYESALSLSRLDRIIDYQPTDMTATVEAGMTLARLQDVLGENGQWLPVEPPSPEHVTIGGLIATNLSGPSRLSQGSIRDFLIGLTVVQADGAVVKGGGRVVKNVAGYDLPKLYCGSLGTLGVIVEATLKVRPRPEMHAALALSFPSAESAMEGALRVLGSELQPLFLEMTNSDLLDDGRGAANPYALFVGFAGITEEVAYQRTRLRELVGGDGCVTHEWEEDALLPLVRALRDFSVTGDVALRCRVSVLPTQVAAVCREIEEEAALRGFGAEFLVRAGNGIVLSRFRRSEEVPPEKLLSFVDWLRVLAKKNSGYVVVEGIDPRVKDRIDVWGHVGGAFPLMKRLKETLDPNGILNPGRFVGGI